MMQYTTQEVATIGSPNFIYSSRTVAIDYSASKEAD